MTSLALVVVSFVSLVLLASVEAIQIVSIDSYGAVANDSSVDAAVKNSHAIANALMKAANGDAVLVPRYSHYYTFSSIVSDIADNVQMWIEGELIAHSNITAWPYNGNDYIPAHTTDTIKTATILYYLERIQASLEVRDINGGSIPCSTLFIARDLIWLKC